MFLDFILLKFSSKFPLKHFYPKIYVQKIFLLKHNALELKIYNKKVKYFKKLNFLKIILWFKLHTLRGGGKDIVLASSNIKNLVKFFQVLN